MATNFHIRSFQRFPVQCPVYYANHDMHGRGIVWNLSLSGWRVDGTQPVSPGMAFTFSVLLPHAASPLFVREVIVRWSRGREFGVETRLIQEAEERSLMRLLESHIWSHPFSPR